MPEIEETSAERHQPQATPSISFADEPLQEAMPTAAPSQGVSSAEVLRELVETIILTLAIFLLIRNFAQNFRVEGSSMEPNLHDRQFLIVNRFAYCPGFHLDVDILDIHWQKVWCIWQPKRGDIIVFHAPDQPKDYIKRVIGLPGEKIQIDKGQVLINGLPVNEPYETRHNVRDAPAVTLGPNQLYVMGDNRPNSRDSRSWGLLSMDAVLGKALLCYWPPRHWAIVPHYTFPDSE